MGGMALYSSHTSRSSILRNKRLSLRSSRESKPQTQKQGKGQATLLGFGLR